MTESCLLRQLYKKKLLSPDTHQNYYDESHIFLFALFLCILRSHRSQIFPSDLESFKNVSHVQTFLFSKVTKMIKVIPQITVTSVLADEKHFIIAISNLLISITLICPVYVTGGKHSVPVSVWIISMTVAEHLYIEHTYSKQMNASWPFCFNRKKICFIASLMILTCSSLVKEKQDVACLLDLYVHLHQRLRFKTKKRCRICRVFFMVAAPCYN